MNAAVPSEMAPGMRAAIEELKGIVAARHPEAEFQVGPSPEDPGVVHLWTTVDVEDPEEVLDLVISRMMELQIENGLPVFVVPVRPPERVRAVLQGSQRHP